MPPGYRRLQETVTLASPRGTAQLDARDRSAAPQIGGRTAALTAQGGDSMPRREQALLAAAA